MALSDEHPTVSLITPLGVLLAFRLSTGCGQDAHTREE